MSTLYEITGEILELQNLLEAGDIDQQIFNDTLEGMGDSLEQKLESCVHVMRNAESDADRFKAEEKFFAEKRKSAENLANRMGDMIKGCMVTLGHEKVQTSRFTLTVGKAGAAPLEIVDPQIVPIEYLKEVEPTWDKAAIKAAIKEGKEVPGCRLGAQAEVLRIR